MKKQYTNFMMQSASEFDQQKVKDAVKAQVQAETPASTETQTDAAERPATDPTPAQIATPVAETIPQEKKAPKMKLRQQAYYLTEEEIKTIKRLSYELDIPKSDLVRKFIDEGISKIDQK